MLQADKAASNIKANIPAMAIRLARNTKDRRAKNFDKEPHVTAEEITKLETYLRKLFNSPGIELRRAPKVDDMVELHKDDEFLGTIYRDSEDGDLSYQVNFAILDIDLE